MTDKPEKSQGSKHPRETPCYAEDDFIEEVKIFINDWCSEYMSKNCSVSFDFSDPEWPTADISLKDDYGHKWNVPVCLNDTTKEIGIDVGDAGTLLFDGTGLYCFLWHDACQRIDRA